MNEKRRVQRSLISRDSRANDDLFIFRELKFESLRTRVRKEVEKRFEFSLSLSEKFFFIYVLVLDDAKKTNPTGERKERSSDVARGA